MRDPLFAKWNLDLAQEEKSPDSAFNLAELVDFSLMNEVFASYLEVVGLPVAIIDFNGRVLSSSNWQRLCMEFHRVNSTTLERCLESDKSLSRHMSDGKNYAIYRCHNGLTDCASPIVIEGQHIANLFIGQFFLEPPSMAYFEAQCDQFGFDPDRYFKALSEVPIVAEEKLPSILKMLVGFATLIAQQSIAEHRARIAYESVEKQVIERTKALVDAKERLEAAASAGIVGIWDWDIENGQLIWDEVMYKLYGIHEDNFTGAYETWSNAIHPDDKAYVTEEIQAALRGERTYAPEFRVIWPDGSVHYIKAVAHTTYDPQGKPLRMVGVNYDLTEQKQIQHKLDYLAFHDQVTDLPNRRLLDERLEQSIAQARPERLRIAVLFIDLDKFKAVNDVYGHNTGDWLLKQVANRIGRCLRKTDTVARIGGDEFVVLLQNIDATDAAVGVAEHIRTLLDQPFMMEDGLALNISSSIGVATYPDHAGNAQELLRFGDEAMYKAKKGGRNTVVVFKAENHNATENHHAATSC
ncbi:PAS domain S-box-containing protein/diguanylate cyclase (GGDEF) domain-containing protein [Vogesella sp. LIG4]|nr:PAS domain S-box-containing protein/diguanylate cyclase (GGDEF) domain-containing protein [Vogesella sp. LIG4]